MFQQTTIPVLEQVVNFAQARHGILAGNIANIDTPGYRTADLSTEKFESKLKEAVQSQGQDSVMHSLAAGGSLADVPFGPELSGDKFDAVRGVKESLNSLLYHDESNVSLENQVAEIAKNQALHNLALTIMNQQFRLMETAIRERVV